MFLVLEPKNITKIFGIGNWTVEMFSIFHLGLSDVMPIGDLGFINAYKKYYKDLSYPAATVIGIDGEKVLIYFLAVSCENYKAIENSRQVRPSIISREASSLLVIKASPLICTLVSRVLLL